MPSILRDGLLASMKDIDNNMTGFPVVWLTDVPTLECSYEQRRAMLKVGILCGPRCRNLPNATVCLKVIIPTGDRRLKHFAMWMCKHQPRVAASPIINRHTWFYRGDIAPDRLAVFKTVPQALPVWLLPEGHHVTSAQQEADLLAGRDGPDDYVKAHDQQ